MTSIEVNAFTSNYINISLQDRGYSVDRILEDDIILPYQLHEIKLKPNDIANAETFNLSMGRLYDCFLYLLSNTKLSPPTNLRYVNTLTSGTENPSPFAPGLKSIAPGWVNTDTIFNTSKTGVHYTLEAYKDAEGKSFLQLWSSLHGLIEGNTSVDHDNAKNFTDIKSLAIDNDSSVYVLDGLTVYQYNINGILEQDPVMLAYEHTPGRQLKLYAGKERVLGPDDDDLVFERTEFCNPRKIVSTGEKLYVIDDNATTTKPASICVAKVYDTRLNWLSTYTLNQVQEFIDIIEYNDRLLVLNKTIDSGTDTVGYYINEYTMDLVLKKRYPLALPPGLPVSIMSSHANPNVLYILRETSIEKVYYSLLLDEDSIKSEQVTLRSYRYHDLEYVTSIIDNSHTITNPNDVLILPGADDIILVRSKYVHEDSAHKLYLEPYFWLENEIKLRDDVLHDEFNHQIYTFDQVTVESEEYTNNLVYNKSIGKFIFNLRVFIENLKGQFAIQKDVLESNGIDVHSKYVGIVNDVDHELVIDGYTATLDNFVHINEPFITSVFNRSIIELYNILLALRDIIAIRDVFESNIFDISDLFPDRCKNAILSDTEQPFITDDGMCIVIDDDLPPEACVFPIVDENYEILFEEGDECIIYTDRQRRSGPPDPTATPVPTAVPTATPVPTAIPTATPFPTAVPTATPLPTSIPIPTSTPVPTSTPSPAPTSTPSPTSTPAPTPTSTVVPVPTSTPSPTSTPAPTPTLVEAVKTSNNCCDTYSIVTPYGYNNQHSIDLVKSDKAIAKDYIPRMELFEGTWDKAYWVAQSMQVILTQNIITFTGNATMNAGETYWDKWPKGLGGTSIQKTGSMNAWIDSQHVIVGPHNELPPSAPKNMLWYWSNVGVCVQNISDVETKPAWSTNSSFHVRLTDENNPKNTRMVYNHELYWPDRDGLKMVNDYVIRDPSTSTIGSVHISDHERTYSGSLSDYNSTHLDAGWKSFPNLQLSNWHNKFRGAGSIEPENSHRYPDEDKMYRMTEAVINLNMRTLDGMYPTNNQRWCGKLRTHDSTWTSGPDCSVYRYSITAEEAVYRFTDGSFEWIPERGNIVPEVLYLDPSGLMLYTFKTKAVKESEIIEKVGSYQNTGQVGIDKDTNVVMGGSYVFRLCIEVTMDHDQRYTGYTPPYAPMHSVMYGPLTEARYLNPR